MNIRKVEGLPYKKQKSQIEKISIWDFPFLSSDWNMRRAAVHAAVTLCVRGRSSDFRIILPAAPSQPYGQWYHTAFVTDHSGGPVPDSHRVPY